MKSLTRRDFLKLSSLFGATALLPWREQFGVIEAEPDSEAAIEAEITKSTAQVDEIMADLTRVLLWLNDEAILGIYEAMLMCQRGGVASFIMSPVGLGGYLDPGCLLAELHCSWLGYPERLRQIYSHCNGSLLGITVALPKMADVLYHGEAMIWECQESLPSQVPFLLKLKPKTLAEFHKFIRARIVFKGIESWSIESI